MMQRLIGWILLSKFLIVLAILYSGIGLMPDEAQYWTWSKKLSYGYYSKPPGIAWQIALGTYLFGDTEFGIRFGSIALSTFLSVGIYLLSKQAGVAKERAFWAALAFSFCPLGFFSGFFATTDCAYVLFWTFACLYFLKESNALGLVIGVGALWKWPIYSVLLPMLAFTKNYRWLVGSSVVALFGLLPPLFWNIEHGFATFRHVVASVTTQTGANPLDFLGAQFALVSPLLLLLIFYSYCSIKMREMTRPLWFCYATGLAFFTAIFAASFFEKVQANWAVATYPTAFVILASTASLRWIKIAIGFSVVLLLLLFVYPLPYRMNPFKEGLGWNKVEKIVLEAGYDTKNEFLFSDRYQATSILSFYGPDKKRAFFLNLHGLRHNQYDYWPEMKDCCLGKTGYFVEFVQAKEVDSANLRFETLLKEYFANVKVLSSQVLVSEANEPKKVAVILRCTDYNGKVPSCPLKF